MQATRTRVSRHLASDGGFTVFEFVAASMILFVVLMGVLGAVEYAGAATKQAAIRQAAIDVATNQIEVDRNLPWANLGITYGNGWVGDPAGSVLATQVITTTRGTFNVGTTIIWGRDTSTPGYVLPSYKRVRVTVAWTDPTASSIAVETNIFGTTTTGNNGFVQVHLRDVDNPSTPLAGINVVMDPYTGTNRIATSGTDGIAFWSDVPVGNATFPSPLTFNPNWLVDVGGLGTQSITAGTKDIGYVDCQRPCTAKIHVHTNSIANYSGAKVTLTDTDRSLTYVGYTGSDGYVTFSASAGDVNGGAGLWKSKSGGYTAVATAGSATSNTGAFLISASGQAYSGLDLLLPDPPSVTVSKAVSSTGAALNGVAWNCTVRDVNNNVVATYSGSDNSFTLPISGVATYTAYVTGVSGFQDSSYAIKTTANGVNQPLVVPMPPLYMIGVKLGSNTYAGAKVWLKNASSGASALTTAGVSTGTTDVNGLTGFIIPADGNYNVSVQVNGQYYPATLDQQTLVAASPPLTTHWVTIPASTITLTVVVPNTSGWWRYVGVWDSSGSLVASGTVNASASLSSAITFTLPGGDYYLGAGGGSGHTVPPATKPTSGTVWSGTLTSPFLPMPKSSIPTQTTGSLSVGPINVQS